MKYLVLLLALLSVACGPAAQSGQPTIEVWKSPTCNCCSKWIEILRADGFNVISHNESAMNPLKTKLGVPAALASCHTGVVEGYVIEGHVPASDIKRLLAERPKAKGLAVPGMPIGSPGMEMGERVDPYDVMLFSAEAAPVVFARHGPKSSSP